MMKKFEDLRVVDLREQLEKRGLDKTGVKAVLIDRLNLSVNAEGGGDTENFEDVETSPDLKESGANKSEDTNGLHPELEESLQEEEEENGVESELHNDDIEMKEDYVEDNEDDVHRKEIVEREDIEESKEEVNESETLEGVEDPAEPFSLEDETNFATSEDLEDLIHKGEVDGFGEGEIEHVRGEGLTQTKFEDDSINLMLDEDEDKMLDYEDESTPGDHKAANQDGSAGGKRTSAGDRNQDSHGKEGHPKSDPHSSRKDRDPKADKANSRNLWVSGLSSSTRAQDLKTLFSKYGKVTSAKIVTDAHTPGARCYGFVTMSAVDEANSCMGSLNQTELHGKVIQVEKAKSDLGGSSKPPGKSLGRNEDDKEEEERKSSDRKDGRDISRGGRSDDRSRDRHDRDRHRDRVARAPARDRLGEKRPGASRRGDRDILSLDTIVSTRDRERERDRMRRDRQDERRREDEELRIRAIERRQKSEAERLKLEREKLLIEREKVEREKLELYRMERETQKLERMRLIKEKEEIRKQQMKYEETRRGLKRAVDDTRRGEREPYDDRRRTSLLEARSSRYPAEDSRYSSRMESTGRQEKYPERQSDQRSRERGSSRGLQSTERRERQSTKGSKEGRYGASSSGRERSGESSWPTENSGYTDRSGGSSKSYGSNLGGASTMGRSSDQAWSRNFGSSHTPSTRYATGANTTSVAGGHRSGMSFMGPPSSSTHLAPNNSMSGMQAMPSDSYSQQLPAPYSRKY